MQLHSFFNSSTSYRVRIALALKGLPYDTLPVNIRTDEHREAGYVAQVNPSASVPALVDGDFRLGQSLAIIDYLDQIHPAPRLIPLEPRRRARVLEFATLIACDIHPVNNLRVLRYLDSELQVTPQQKRAWYRHWIAEGMAGAERLLARAGTSPWCFGAAPTLADICLVPQVANALRMDCDLSAYPRSLAVHEHARREPAFEAAQPQRQPDYVA
ncbi:maleylacetoacetate isomerase [Burkholderia sp. PR2]|uniref:maleylacetoacetate isomerase n=1 Tax=Burkholderia sp. PR2 TaxID=3448078 RepID=UPI00402A9159